MFYSLNMSYFFNYPKQQQSLMSSAAESNKVRISVDVIRTGCLSWTAQIRRATFPQNPGIVVEEK